MTAKLFKRTAQKFDTIAHVSWIPLLKIVGGSLSIRRNVCRDSEGALKFPNGLHVEVVTWQCQRGTCAQYAAIKINCARIGGSDPAFHLADTWLCIVELINGVYAKRPCY